MKFNKFDGSGPQEIMLMKQAIAEALEPSNKTVLAKVTVSEPYVIEGPYTGFTLIVPASYDGEVSIKFNDEFSLTITNGVAWSMLDGILTYATSSGAVRRIYIDTTHTLQKYSVLDKIELSTTSPSGMGVEFDVVLRK